jgi:ribosome-binding protein aMBF1 (putative translation factor)
MKDAKQKLKIEFEDKTGQSSKTNEKSQEDEEAKTEEDKTEEDKTEEDKTEEDKTEEDKTEEDKTESVEDNEETASKNKKELPQKLEMEPGVVLKFSSDENIDKRQLRVRKFNVAFTVVRIESPC